MYKIRDDMSMMMNLRRRYGGKVLPYDAEVEYLKSTGTQIVAFPISNASSDVYFSVYAEIMPLYVAPGNTRRYIMSCQPSDQCSVWFYSRNTSRGVITYASSVGKISAAGGITLDENAKAHFELSTTHIDDVGGVRTVNRPLTSNISYFYAFNHPNYIGFPIKLYSLLIIVGDNVAYDIIPVRIGTVGYLYDKVSRQLFGNSGTGAFVVGPDVISGGG